MVNFLFLMLYATIFLMVAILLAEGFLRRSEFAQDVVWRSTLVAILLLPCSLVVPYLAPGIRFSFPIQGVALSPLEESSGAENTFGAPSVHQEASPETRQREVPRLPVPSPIQRRDGEESNGIRPSNNETKGMVVVGRYMEERERINESSTLEEAKGSTPLQVSMIRIVPWLIGFWVLGAIIKWITLAFGWGLQIDRASKAQSAQGTLWGRVSERMHSGKRKRLRVAFSSDVSSPILAGLWHPVVLVPHWMQTTDDESMVEQILIHERAHLERGDQWTNFLLQWVGVFLWMHPLFYWMRWRMLFLREVLCDAYVLQRIDAVGYSETLLNLARQVSARRFESMALGMVMPRSLLGRRIAYLLRNNPVQSSHPFHDWMRWGVWTLAVMAPLACGFLHVQGAPHASLASLGEGQSVEESKVQGTVQLPGGNPAVRARVYLHRIGTGAMTLPVQAEIAETDQEGKYLFEKVSVGTYRIWAETDQQTSLEEKLRGTKIEISADHQKETVVDLKLHDGCHYSVTVWDKSKGIGVANADIFFGWTDIDRHYKTKENGIAEIGGLAMDEWYFVVKAKGYGIQYRKLPKQPLGSRTQIRFDLEEGTDLIGTIRDESGKPVAGATIGVYERRGGMNPGYGRTESDAEGKFEFPSIPREKEIQVHATAEGFLRLSADIAIPSNERQLRRDLVITKRPYGGDCIIKVVNERGEPLPNAKITNTGNSSADVRTATTDGAGLARLNDIFTSYSGTSGTVRADGYIAEQVRLIAGSQEKPGEVTLELKKGETIRGRLIKPNGEPAAKVWVFYNRGESGFGGLGGRVDTDAEGRFQIDGLPNPSTFTIYTPAPYAPIRDRTLPVGKAEEVLVKMEPESVIRVRAIDRENGKAIPEFNVRVHFAKDRRPNDPIMSLNSELLDPGKEILGEMKEFRLGQLPKGFALQVTVAAKGYDKMVLDRVEALPEEESDVIDVPLNREDESKFCVVSGRLVDTDGRPVAGAVLKLVIGEDENQSPESLLRRWSMIDSGQVAQDPSCLQFLTTTTKRDGSFRWERVIDGNWKELVHTGGNVANGRFELRASRERHGFEDLKLEAKHAGVVHVEIDRKKYSKVSSISLDLRADGLSLGEPRKQMDPGEDKMVIEGVAPGVYRATIYEIVASNGNGFTQKAVKSMDIEVVEGEEVKVSFR